MGLISFCIDRYLLDNPNTLTSVWHKFKTLASSNSRPSNPTDTYLNQDGMDKTQPEIQVDLTIIRKLLVHQSQQLWTRLKKNARLDRVYTKARPQTGDWSKILHRLRLERTLPMVWI